VILAKDSVPQYQTKKQSKQVVKDPELVPYQVPENGDEAEDAQAHVEEGKHFRGLVQSTGKEDWGEEDGVDGGWVA